MNLKIDNKSKIKERRISQTKLDKIKLIKLTTIVFILFLFTFPYTSIVINAFFKETDEESVSDVDKSNVRTNSVSYSIFATRIGLVGQTTANGHIIQSNDRFVALPSSKVLCSNGGNEFQVRISYNGKSVTAPVWDIGPWNIQDDYWNPSQQREMWNDLPQGMPEAQAAYQNGYNSGKDQYGRTVSNAAGIDLADGIFWGDLGMTDNDWVTVEFLWVPSVSVRDSSPYFTKGSNSGNPDYWHTYIHDGHEYLWTYIGGMTNNPLQTDCWAEFRPYFSQAGTYEVYSSFYADPENSDRVPHTVYYDGGTTTVNVSQYASSYFTWTRYKLGTWDFAAGASSRIIITDANGDIYDGTTLNADTIEFVLVSQPSNNKPNTPTLVGQYLSDGITPIPEGGTTSEHTVVFKAYVSDPDDDDVILEIELRNINEPFYGVPTGETISIPYPSGSQASVTRYGLDPNGYKWQYRAKDSEGEISHWVEFGTPGNTDFTVYIPINNPPNIPISPLQLKSDGVTQIPEGGTTSEHTVVFKAFVNDPDGDDVILEIELCNINEPFSGIPTGETISIPYPSGSEASVTRYGLDPNGYKWQYRAKDSEGEVCDWVEFGTPGNTDFTVYIPINNPPNIPVSPLQLKSDGITQIPESGTTNEHIVVFRAFVSDPDGDDVILEIELRNINEPFSGIPTDEYLSPIYPSGSEATLVWHGLDSNGYKWQYRAKDLGGEVSDWVEFGTPGNTDFTVYIPFNNPPSIPYSLQQLKSDGLTSIPEGDITDEDIVVFKANVFDFDGDDVYLEIELRQTSEDLIGEPTFQTDTPYVSGSTITLFRGWLVNADYRWQCRARDTNGARSDWVEFGTPGNLDFTVDVPINSPPDIPFSVDQLELDHITSISEGGTYAASEVTFKGIVSDPDDNMVRLEIELRQFNEAFIGEPTYETITNYALSWSQVSVTRYGLVPGDYHWQYRAMDINGAYSEWCEFGVIGNIDFTIVENRPPELSNGYVTPTSGEILTLYNFYVTYSDPDGDAPLSSVVYIDDVPFLMEMISGDYITGAIFQCTKNLDSGDHNFYFEFEDYNDNTIKLPSTGHYQGPTVLLESPIHYEWDRSWGEHEINSGNAFTLDSSNNIYYVGSNQVTDEEQGDISLIKFNSQGIEQWSTSWGGNAVDSGRAIIIDSLQNIYVAGHTESYGYGQLFTPDICVIKYNQFGEVIWSRIWGGEAHDYCTALAVDSDDNVYVAGKTRSFGEGGYDMVLLKYNSLGILQWQRIWGGHNWEDCYGMEIDSSNNIFLVGYTNSYGIGDADICLVKFDINGNELWYRTWGDYGTEYGYDIALDSSNNIFITGFIHSVISGEFYSEMVLIKYNSLGIEQWYKTWRISKATEGYGIALDSLNNIYITGMTGGAAGSPSAFLIKYNSLGIEQWYKIKSGIDLWGGGVEIAVDSLDNIFISGRSFDPFFPFIYTYGYDNYLLKYDTTGNLVWEFKWGGTSNDFGIDTALDSENNVYVAGLTESYGSGGFDTCLLKYDGSGYLIWSSTWGSSKTEGCYGIAIDSLDNIYITGYTYDDEDSNYDMFLLKYDKFGNLIWSKIWGDSGMEIGMAVFVDSFDNIYVTGAIADQSYFDSHIDSFILKYDSNGLIQWEKTLQRAKMTVPTSLSLDTLNNIYITGMTEFDFYDGGPDIFVAKFDNFGVELWYNEWGSENIYDFSYAIDIDSLNNVYIAGSTQIQTEHNTGDMLLIKYDQLGNQQWIRTWGGIGNEICTAMKIDQYDDIYLAGPTDSFAPSTTETCIVKYDSSGNYKYCQLWNKGSSDYYHHSINVDSFGNIYLAGYTNDALLYDCDISLVKFSQEQVVPPTIHINSNNQWAIAATSYDWCTGSGTLENPYIIQDLEIDTTGYEHGILIENTDVYFIIERCTIYNSQEAAIRLFNTINGKLIDNRLSYNQRGISIVEGQNIIIFKNIICYNSLSGIDLIFSRDNSIYQNTVSNNNGWGMFIYECDTIHILNNTVNYNAQVGILVESDLGNTQDNVVSQNYVSYNGWNGIYLERCENSEISRNFLSHNNEGIKLYESDNNKVFQNTINSNNGGLRVENSYNNIIYMNSFSGNFQNIFSQNSNNYWNSQEPIVYYYNGITFENYLGNHWDDYYGSDLNYDGIGETDYNINGECDNYPLIDDGNEYYKSSHIPSLFDGLYMESTAEMSYSSPITSKGTYSYLGNDIFKANMISNMGDGSYDLHHKTRIILFSEGVFNFGINVHAPFWIFPNVKIGDTILIAVASEGDHLFRVSSELLYNYRNSDTLEVWKLDDLTLPGGYLYFEKNTGLLVHGMQYFQGGLYNYTFELTDTNANFQLYQPLVANIKLQRGGIEIYEIDVGEYFDIYIGDSSGDIFQVQFMSDESQDGIPEGIWTDPYDWDTTLEEWNAQTKIKMWLFATGGTKEVWVRVIDKYGRFAENYAYINAIGVSLILTSALELNPEKEFYYIGETLTATFTIKNERNYPITLDVLTVGGRLNKWIPKEGAPDFTHQSVTLMSKQEYQYEGTITLNSVGNYRFFVAYYIENPSPNEEQLLDENNWNTCINLGQGLTHGSRVKNVFVVDEEITPDDLSELRNRIQEKLTEKIIYPPYLLDPDAYNTAWISTVWYSITSWLRQENLVEKYDEFYHTGINYDSLSFQSLKNAKNALNDGFIDLAKIYLDDYYRLQKLSAMSFSSASEFFDNGLQKGQELAYKLLDFCLTTFKIGMYGVNPTIAKYLDFVFIPLQFIFEKDIYGLEEATIKAGYRVFMKFVFTQIPIENGLSIEDMIKNGVDYNFFPIIANIQNDYIIQQQMIQILEAVFITVPKSKIVDMMHKLGDLLLSMNKKTIQVKSPVELKVYNSEDEVTGLINGEVKHQISRSIYFNETVIIFYPDDSYLYNLKGTEEGTYGLEIKIYENGVHSSFIAENIPISVNEIHQYEIDWFDLSQGEEGVKVDIDSDGDGTIEHSFTSDNELNTAEYVIETLTWPYEGDALQDGVIFEIDTFDNTLINWITVSIRGPGGEDGIFISDEFENIPLIYDDEHDIWESTNFDTTQLPDGYYVLFLQVCDASEFTSTITFDFSIRNWALLELLPATERNRAGRTMPVKFSLRVVKAVDPEMPFVCNEELEIIIYDKNNPDIILQFSIFGDTSVDYRISSEDELYITNFKTLKTEATYVVEIWRKGMFIGAFEFETYKSKIKIGISVSSMFENFQILQGLDLIFLLLGTTYLLIISRKKLIHL